MEALIKPPQNLKCPRCDSEDTKFCYFNNNKSSQPRYRCKKCNRFWTQGGKLRDIPSSAAKRRVKRSQDSFTSTISSPPAPLLSSITFVAIDFDRAGDLNLTRPRPNQPRIEFVRTDINSLSITKSRAPPQHAQGQKYYAQPNQNVFQASNGQGIPAIHYMGGATSDPSMSSYGA
ncbi:hypothetical protein ACET3Z_013309 [Daucus carota]